MDEARRRWRQDAGLSGKADHRGSRIAGEDEGKLHRGGDDPVRVGLVLACAQVRQDRGDEDRERREPAGARRKTDPRLRRLGAQLLHRLSQPPRRLSEGVRRPPRQLGLCRRDARGRDQRSARHRRTALRLVPILSNRAVMPGRGTHRACAMGTPLCRASYDGYPRQRCAAPGTLRP